MSIAAVPAYLGKDFSSASPGMRFGMYLPIWTSRDDQEQEVKNRAARKSPEGEQIAALLQRHGMDAAIAELTRQNRLPALWKKNDFAAREAWKKVTQLTPSDRAGMQALHMRQRQLFSAIPRTEGLCLDAKSIAPFTTGLGNEHPLENGFAFLNPYGLPYLPGSGVKGVLRQAARELASGDWGDAHGWSAEARFPLLQGPAERRKPVCDKKNGQPILLTQTDVLFGRETPAGDSEHLRGVLSFWDVIPQLQGDSLAVEIMTPHQNHYYQQKSERKTGDSTSPDESGQPIPIPFLTVPPGSRFTFCVVCDLPRLRRLAPELAQDDRWKTLLTAAFEHAFEWLGFGAKTAVGYGAMARLNEEQVTAAREQVEALQLRCDWVDQTVRELASKNRASESDTLRSKGLAEAWAAISDADLKARALADIRARWSQAGWWDAPPGGSAKKAKAIYEAGE